MTRIWKNPLAALAFLLILFAAPMVFFASSGTWTHWTTYRHDFSAQAAAFLHGQMSLLQKPLPQLLALPDPYDPAQNDPYRAHDEVLYHGKYYEYWGPAPALIIAALWGMVGSLTPQFGDQYPSFFFLFGTVAIASGLIFRLKAIYFPAQSNWTAVCVACSLGLSAPVLYLANRMAIYEGAIAAGQMFLLGGLCFAWRGLSAPRLRIAPLAAAGVCWTMACASRISLPPAVAAITAFSLYRIHLRADSNRLGAGAALMAPLIIGALAMAWYNQARFGSPLDFGMQYQLSAHFQRGPQAAGFVSVHNLAPEAVAYLLSPPATARSFPYVFVVENRHWLLTWFRLPRIFQSESVTGVLWTQPFLLFAPVGLALAVRNKSGDLRWLAYCLAAGGVLSFFPGLLLAGSVMRYLLDLTPCLTVLAAIGLWLTLQALSSQPRWRRELWMLVRLVLVYQCGIGLLLAVSGNPTLLQAARGHFPLI